METYNWYQVLVKPEWAPPAWVFGPVWTFLYILITVSFGYIFFMYFKNKINFFVVLPFILNLIFNFAFTPIQFGLQNNILASLDILLVLGTIVWAGFVVFPYFPWIVYINIPYFLWVLFASFLQLNITYLNL